MLQSLIETVTALGPVVFPLVFVSQLLLGLINNLIKLFYRPTIRLHPAGEIEIAFDRLGPNATLFGTMQAIGGDFFITKIEATFRHLTTGFSRTLEWRAFKPYRFGFNNEEEVRYELAAAFALKVNEPFKYNIVFIDDAFINQGLEQVRMISSAWDTFQSKMGATLTGRALVEAFYNQPDIQAIAQDWQESMYWQAGAYELNVGLYSGKRQLRFAYTFTLADREVAILRNNVQPMIFHLCGERVAFGRVFAPYGQTAGR